MDWKAFVLMSCIVCSLGLGGSGIAIAQEASLDDLLQDVEEIVVVTASKYAQKLSEAPATVRVITRGQIEERGYQTLTDIFYDLPGLDVSHNNYVEYGFTTVLMRGLLGNNKIQVLLNGSRLNSPAGENFIFSEQIPLHWIERIEIVYGPGSALYGADAFAGVINLITRTEVDAPQLDALVSYGTENTTVDQVLVSQTFENGSLLLGGHLYKSDDVNLAEEYPEDFEDAMAGWAPLEDDYSAPIEDYDGFLQLTLSDFTIEANRWRVRGPSNAGQTPYLYIYNDRAVWEATKDQVSVKYEQDWDRTTATTTVSYERYEVDPESNYYMIYGDFYKYAWARSSRIEQKVDFQMNERWHLTGGIMAEDVSSLPTTYDLLEPFDPDDPIYFEPFFEGFDGRGVLNYQNFGVYAQANGAITDQLSTTAGFRFDYNTLYDEVLNPRFSLVYQPTARLTAKAIFGMAYIAPSPYEKYLFWMTPEYGHITNEDLEPEVVQSYELRLAYRISEKANAGLSIFRNNAQDLIVHRYAGEVPIEGVMVPVEKTVNSGELYTQGAELTTDWRPTPKLNTRLAYSYIDGEIDEAGTSWDVPKVSQHKLTFGATVRPIDRVSLNLRGRWVSNIRTQLSNSKYGEAYGGDNEMDGYTVLNAHLRVREILPKLEAFLTVKNVLDETYYEAGTDTENDDYSIYMPGTPQDTRTILFGVRYRLN